MLIVEILYFNHSFSNSRFVPSVGPAEQARGGWETPFLLPGTRQVRTAKTLTPPHREAPAGGGRDGPGDPLYVSVERGKTGLEMSVERGKTGLETRYVSVERGKNGPGDPFYVKRRSFETGRETHSTR